MCSHGKKQNYDMTMSKALLTCTYTPQESTLPCIYCYESHTTIYFHLQLVVKYMVSSVIITWRYNLIQYTPLPIHHFDLLSLAQ